jgi:hypothetical protein
MTLHVPISEHRRGSRIDDLGTTHSSVCDPRGDWGSVPTVGEAPVVARNYSGGNRAHPVPEIVELDPVPGLD